MGRAFEYRRASKEARWGKMSKLFPKLGKAITMAAKEGGEDPLMNSKLRAAIATAKAQNMPKDNIEPKMAQPQQQQRYQGQAQRQPQARQNAPQRQAQPQQGQQGFRRRNSAA